MDTYTFFLRFQTARFITRNISQEHLRLHIPQEHLHGHWSSSLWQCICCFVPPWRSLYVNFMAYVSSGRKLQRDRHWYNVVTYEGSERVQKANHCKCWRFKILLKHCAIVVIMTSCYPSWQSSYTCITLRFDIAHHLVSHNISQEHVHERWPFIILLKRAIVVILTTFTCALFLKMYMYALLCDFVSHISSRIIPHWALAWVLVIVCIVLWSLLWQRVCKDIPRGQSLCIICMAYGAQANNYTQRQWPVQHVHGTQRACTCTSMFLCAGNSAVNHQVFNLLFSSTLFDLMSSRTTLGGVMVQSKASSKSYVVNPWL